jgi:excisionase family DNA binding protein
MMIKGSREESSETIPVVTMEHHLTEVANPLWTVEDVACYLKLQPETIRCMARQGALPAIKFGKVWRFDRKAIYAMLVEKG